MKAYIRRHLKKLEKRKGGGNNMSLTDIIIKIAGVVLAVVGVLLLLSIVGLGFGVSLQPWILALVVGFAFLAVGIFILRGGQLSL